MTVKAIMPSLTLQMPLGYTPPVTSKKGVIGCESPLARGAKPHPAWFAAFLFLAPSFGGPDGEAQASPVTLRVPRSLTPVRAAAQCESWSAVVHQAQLEINMAQLVRRDFRPGLTSFTALPFVADVKVAPRKKRRSFWNVPQTDDYGSACDAGRQYACDLIQYLKDNPLWVGSNTIGNLVQDMAAHPPGTAVHGYQVGFWSTLEVLLHRAASREDHWHVVQAVQDRYDAINTARENKAIQKQDTAGAPT